MEIAAELYLTDGKEELYCLTDTSGNILEEGIREENLDARWRYWEAE